MARLVTAADKRRVRAKPGCGARPSCRASTDQPATSDTRAYARRRAADRRTDDRAHLAARSERGQRCAGRALRRALRLAARQLAERPTQHRLVRRRCLSVVCARPRPLRHRRRAAGAGRGRRRDQRSIPQGRRPAGGGYGFVIRNQGSTADLDGKSQNGSYLVVEVGDRGEVGIWQRDGARWIDVLTWRHADAVRTGEDPNLLVLYSKVRRCVSRSTANRWPTWRSMACQHGAASASSWAAISTKLRSSGCASSPPKHPLKPGPRDRIYHPRRVGERGEP